jgi:hypothetical protein
MAHNEVAGSQREQSRLIFNGPVGCYKQLAGLFNVVRAKGIVAKAASIRL